MNYENFVAAVEGLALKYQRMNPDERISVKHTDCGLELTRAPKEQMRKQWVAQMLAEYSEDFGSFSEVILCDKKRKVIVAYFNDYWATATAMAFPSVLRPMFLMKTPAWQLLSHTSVVIPFLILCKIFVGRNGAPLFCGILFRRITSKYSKIGY